MTPTESPLSQHPRPRAGDVYEWIRSGGVRVRVRRVSRTGAWADIRVIDSNGQTWTKRQPLKEGRMPYPVRSLTGTVLAEETP